MTDSQETLAARIQKLGEAILLATRWFNLNLNAVPVPDNREDLASMEAVMRQALADLPAIVAEAKRLQEYNDFPVLLGRDGLQKKYIPWEIAEKAYSAYVKKYGTGQSLARIGGRGGFWESEMDELYPAWRSEVDETFLLRERLAASDALIDRLVEALQFYAKHIHWKGLTSDSKLRTVLVAMSGDGKQDGWRVAEDALSAAEEYRGGK